VEQLEGESEHTETFNAVQELELQYSRGMGKARQNAAGLMMCITTYQACLHPCNAWTGFIVALRS
jgi:hypothetical protein